VNIQEDRIPIHASRNQRSERKLDRTGSVNQYSLDDNLSTTTTGATTTLHYLFPLPSPQTRTGCWGTFPTPTGEHVERHFRQFEGGNGSLTVPVVDPLSLLAPDDVVIIMKIDTEGAELDIMHALLPALKAGRILNLMVELNKGVHNPATGQPEWPEWRRKGAWRAGQGEGGDTRGGIRRGVRRGGSRQPCNTPLRHHHPSPHARPTPSPPTPARADIVNSLTEVVEAGYTLLCAQYGKTASWGHTPGLTTRAEIEEFSLDGWRAANVWITRNIPGLPEQ
jgi:hypothetical protein